MMKKYRFVVKAGNLKIKPLLTIVAIASIVIYSGCKKWKAPVACFTASKQHAAVGEQISFTSCSSDAGECRWTFEDNLGMTNSSGVSATHIYTADGIYTV